MWQSAAATGYEWPGHGVHGCAPGLSASGKRRPVEMYRSTVCRRRRSERSRGQ